MPEGDVVQGDIRVHVGTEATNSFLAEGEETERGSFGAMREDAEVLHVGSVLQGQLACVTLHVNFRVPGRVPVVRRRAM